MTTNQKQSVDYNLEVTTLTDTYPICITQGLSEYPHLMLPYLQAYRSVVLITNTTLAALHLTRLSDAIRQLNIEVLEFILPDGETYKDVIHWEWLLTQLIEHGVDRKTPLLAFGGGVVGDLTGFVAACYQRGVPFIQMPTTLLAQVDSSVGGKTAINHPLAKNMIGAFYQPCSVLIDIDFLKTLPDREFYSGMAEVIKYALLGDRAFFSYLHDHQAAIRARDPDVLKAMIHHCCSMKAAIVGRDEKETGERALLNLGHTFAHAIEVEAGLGVYLHGEAVAIGMMMAAQASVKRNTLSPNDLILIRQLLMAFDLPIQAPVFSTDQWLRLMMRDKKTEAGIIYFILLDGIGQAVKVPLASNFLADLIQHHYD
jgi:3-dehydroquinate synthase